MLGTRTGRRARGPLAAGLVAVVTLASCASAAGESTAPVKRQDSASKLIVATADGRLRGQAAGTIDEFLGVPYAAPPVGRLRWRAPQPAARSFASPAEALGAVGTDAIFACPALTMDEELSRFTPTFAYEFNDEHAPERFLR